MALKFFIEPYGENTWTKDIITRIPHTETTIIDCDFIISSKMPYACINPSIIQTVLESYQDSIKKVIVFLLSDYNEPLNIPSNVIFFRSGLYKSQRKSNEHLIPYIWVRQELQDAVPFPPIQIKQIKPTIGFCGSIMSHPCRIQHINKIKLAPDIRTNFILRTSHWAGKPHDKQVVTEFVKNIQSCLFTLCSRGTGNWSARFYQVLYLGRIPVVVNTDLLLPFEDEINWADTIVLCQSDSELQSKIKQFNSSNDITAAQMKCKSIYDNYLDPDVWCKRIAEDILLPLVI